MPHTIEVSDLTVSLTSNGDPILSGASFALDSGQVMGVVGESGSGKSTLALAMLGFARRGVAITGGSVRIDGRDILSLSPEELRKARGNVVAYVPQDPSMSLNPSLSLRTQLTEGLEMDEAEAIPVIRQLLASVELPNTDAFLKRVPGELSGGQQQRIAIAMAAAARPRLLVFDEPTTGLDVSTQASVLELVRELCKVLDVAAIYITHDLAVVAHVADSIMVMYNGEVVEAGTSEQVLLRPEHSYTQALIAAVPSVTGPMPRLTAHLGTEVEERSDPETDGRSIAFEVSHLNASYGGKQVVFDAGFELERGKCLAVVGESGSGKTTMSRCLIGLHTEQTAEYRLEGVGIPTSAAQRSNAVQRQLQYVFQSPYRSLNPRRTIESSIALPLRHYFDLDAKTTRARVREALERVEIPASFAERVPAELSGGQRQRVAIARALVCEPRVLLCDEVTSALDVIVQASVIELLRTLLDDGLTMLFVTHNLAVVRSIADDVIVLSQGRIVESGTTDELFLSPQHDYTKQLMADTLDLPVS